MDHYNIYRSSDGVNFALIGATKNLGYSDFSSLTAGKYYYRITAVDNVAISPHEGPAAEAATTVGYAPEESAPTGGIITGGGGGSYITCTEKWTCSDWSDCIEGTQSRTCTDDNSCGTTKSKPVLTQSCEALAFSNLQTNETVTEQTGASDNVGGTPQGDTSENGSEQTSASPISGMIVTFLSGNIAGMLAVLAVFVLVVLLHMKSREKRPRLSSRLLEISKELKEDYSADVMTKNSSLLDKIAKDINSLRPLSKRYELKGMKIKRKITTDKIEGLIRSHSGVLEEGGLARGSGYFVQECGNKYVIKAYTLGQFMLIDLEKALYGKHLLPEPKKQWEVDKNELNHPEPESTLDAMSYR